MKTIMSERRNQNAPENSPTRRQVIAGVAMTFGGLALGLTKVRAASGEDISRTAESIHQENVFKASRNRVYEAVLNERKDVREKQLARVALWKRPSSNESDNRNQQKDSGGLSRVESPPEGIRHGLNFTD